MDDSGPTPIPATTSALREALDLSNELLADIELSRIPLANALLKISRLARLLNDFDTLTILKYESSGYPTTGTGLSKEVWRLAGIAGRHFAETKESDGKDGKPKGEKVVKQYAYRDSISELEATVTTAMARIEAARDPAVSISSANPNQWLKEPTGNTYERTHAVSTANTATARVAQRRSFLHDYVLRRNFELRFSRVASDVFSRYRGLVDERIGLAVPNAVMKFVAVHEGLDSSNHENWANAVHSCRRILQDLADAVFPPRDEPRTVERGGKSRTIKLGPDNYVNRLVCYVEDNQGSATSASVIGSNLSFLGERLDSIFSAAQKGSHGSVTREEADRFVVQTYLMVGDILRLRETHGAT